MLRKILIGIGGTASVVAVLSSLWYLFSRAVLEFLAIIISLMFYLLSSAY